MADGLRTTLGRWLGPLLLAACGAAFAGGNALPEPLSTFSATYRLTNGSIRLGTTNISLQPHAAGWRYRSVTEADGLVGLFVSGQAVDSTLLERHGDRLRPTAYRHTEPDDEDNVRVDFDWTAGRARIRDNAGQRTLDLADDTVDGFSATLTLIRALAQGRERIRIPTIDDQGERETLMFRAAGRERIEVPYGTYDAVRVDRVREDKDRATITWLAPALDWVALRIDQREDGELAGRLELLELRGAAAGGDG